MTRGTARNLVRSLLAFTLVAAGVIAVDSGVASAQTMTVRWQLPAGQYGIGIDHVGVASGGAYEQYYEYPTSACNNNQILPNPLTISSAGTMTSARIEIYRGNFTCGKIVPTSGMVVTIPPSPATQDVGLIPYPDPAQSNAGYFTGRVLSSTPVAAGRVTFAMFQTTGQPTTSKGYRVDAFAAGSSGGATYTSTTLWNGTYVVFLTDTVTNRSLIGQLDLKGATTFDIDLDQVCFGVDDCQWSGSVPSPQGRFHALSPTRIVDSRTNLGIVGAPNPGDGRLGDPNPINRYAAIANHEFSVLGRGGVPASGVSAVLVNITVVSGLSGGAMRVFPKPFRSNYLGDQTSFPPSNGQSAVVEFGAYDVRASTQLIKIGTGGKMRVDNVSFTPTHIVVDVMGWVDSSQPGQGGQRLVTVTPTRVMSSTQGINTPRTPFQSGETRTVVVRNGVTVPSDAEGVLGVLTSTNVTSRGYDLVYPANTARRTASALNTQPGQARSNMAMSPTDANGAWNFLHAGGAGDVLFDVSAYVTSATGSGGLTTPLPSTRFITGAPLVATQELRVGVAGYGGVPSSGARAVWVLITAIRPGQPGYITAYPGGITRTGSSNVNFVAGQNVATMALVPIGADGTIRLWTSAPVYVHVDMLGWVN